MSAREWQPGEPEVEAAARALYEEERNESMGFDAWPEYDDPENVGRHIYEGHARAALIAAHAVTADLLPVPQADDGAIEDVVARAAAVIHEHEGICSCGHDSSVEHNSNGCYARISYEPLTTCDCTLDHGEGTSAVVVARALAAAGLLSGGVPGRSESDVRGGDL